MKAINVFIEIELKLKQVFENLPAEGGKTLFYTGPHKQFDRDVLRFTFHNGIDKDPEFCREIEAVLTCDHDQNFCLYTYSSIAGLRRHFIGTLFGRHYAEKDIIFRTRRPRDLEAHMRGAKGSLRMVGDVNPAGLTTVYFRPPEAYLEQDSLLMVLRRRLRS